MIAVFDPFEKQFAVVDDNGVLIQMFPRHKGNLLDADLILELAGYKTTRWTVDENAFYLQEVTR